MRASAASGGGAIAAIAHYRLGFRILAARHAGGRMVRVLAAIASLVGLCGTARAADEMPWRVTLYGGIATRLDTSDIFLHGHFHPDGSVAGVALDGDIADLGSGFTLIGEGGMTRFLSKSDETSFDVGIGGRYSFHVGDWPISVSGLTGPSFADDPPVIATGTYHGADINFRKQPWLNYVGAEVAVGIPELPQWNGVIRFYHRSGAFGLFAPNADEGSMLGAGVQYRF